MDVRENDPPDRKPADQAGGDIGDPLANELPVRVPWQLVQNGITPGY